MPELLETMKEKTKPNGASYDGGGGDKKRYMSAVEIIAVALL